MKKIYEGDVKARVDAAIENCRCYVGSKMKRDAQEVKDIAELYKKSGWKAVAILIKHVNEECWVAYALHEENVSKFYGELYHAACAWYQGYPANEEEQKNANPEDGSFDHVDEDDMCKIYKFLD